MSTQAIAGNENYTKVDNTVLSQKNLVDAQANLVAAQAGSSLAELKAVRGRATITTSTGNFAVQNDQGTTLQLPQGALVREVLLGSDSALTPAGTSEYTVVLSATDGGGAGTALHADYVPTGAFVSAAPAVVTPLAGSNTDIYVSVAVSVAGSTVGGELAVTLYYAEKPE